MKHIEFSTRRAASAFLRKRVILSSGLLLVIFGILILYSQYGDFGSFLWLCMAAAFYCYCYLSLLSRYLPLLSRSYPPVRVDEEGIHTKRIHLKWESIAAIYPLQRYGLKRNGSVVVVPHQVGPILLYNNIPYLLRALIGLSTALNRLLFKLPPFILLPDDVTGEELAEQLSRILVEEYQRYSISSHLQMNVVK